MNNEIDKNTAILMGQGTPNQIQEIKPSEQQQLTNAYLKLFFGLAGTNWEHQDTTLGAAWYRALQQINGMIGAKDKNNPAAMYLNQIFVSHRAKWSQIIMTHHHKDAYMELSPDAKPQWHTRYSKNIADAMAAINAIIMRYQQQKNAAKQQTSMSDINLAIITKQIQSNQNVRHR